MRLRYVGRKVLGVRTWIFVASPSRRILLGLIANELDTSDELDEQGIKKYQGLVGAIQWAVSIGRMDVATAIMTISKFRATPREGHME